MQRSLQAWNGIGVRATSGIHIVQDYRFYIVFFVFVFFVFVFLLDQPVSKFPVSGNPELYQKGEQMRLQTRESFVPARA